MQLVVRPVRKTDWKAVREIEGHLTNPWEVVDHREFLRPERNATYVATDGQRIYGFVSVTVMPEHVLVERLAVHPGARRNRIGTALLDTVGRFYATAKRARGQALVTEYDVGAQVFLRSCGWKWAKSIPYWGVADEYVFLKEFGK